MIYVCNDFLFSFSDYFNSYVLYRVELKLDVLCDPLHQPVARLRGNDEAGQWGKKQLPAGLYRGKTCNFLAKK